MKKSLFLFAACLLLGAGCTLMSSGDTEVQPWTLTFDAGNEWIMIPVYSESSTPINVTGDIEKNDAEVYIQNTMSHIVAGTSMPDGPLFDGVNIVTEGYTRIHVTKLDTRRILPDTAEDLGDGFYRDLTCEDPATMPCGQKGNTMYDYYFVGEGAKYKFDVAQEGQNIEVAEEVIFSAEEVE